MEITWDLIILVSLASGTLYSAFFGRNKIMGILVYFYLALAVATVAGDTLYNWVANLGFVSAQLAATPVVVKGGLFALVTLLLAFKSEISGLDSDGSLSKVEAGVLGFAAAAFALAAVLSFMAEAELQEISSNFALIIANYHAIIVVIPVLLMVGLSFIKRR